MVEKTALITGASRGIGRACALALARAGARVILAARRLEGLQEVAAAARALGREAYAVEIDLGNPESISAGLERAVKEFGRVQILVNNAAITKDGLAMRMKRADWDAVIGVNLTGTFTLTQQVIPPMVRERWGRIVNISSVVGECGNPGQANYVAAKAGLIGLTKSLAQELASRSITVNAVTPGFIETDMTAVLSDELKSRMLERIPLGRFGQPDDVAAAVRFLASDEAAYITGHVLKVNGGMYM
jgi:3-oxoacyl-[acyl-carrier protein] reductase